MKAGKDIKIFIEGVRSFGQYTPMAPVAYGVGNTPKTTIKKFHGIEYRTKAEKKAIRKQFKKFLNRKAA